MYTMFEYSNLTLIFLLVGWHFIADYSLQSDFIAEAKNRNTDIGKVFWVWVLPGHSMVHASGVTIITGSLIAGLFEFTIHTICDFLKCEDKITLGQDQYIHLLTKIVIVTFTVT